MSEDKLKKLLSSPEALGKIAEIARGLMAESGSQEPAAPKAADETGAEPDLSSVASLLSELKLGNGLLKALGTAAKSYGDNGQKLALLKAMRGRGKRSDELIDKASRAMQLAHAANAVLKTRMGGDKPV